MAEYVAPPGEGESAPDLARELLDVLMRGLNTANESLVPSVIAAGGLCVGYYVDGDHSCALWYSHPT
jgi:hypothetical protein